MKKAQYRKLNDHSLNSSTYHKKDGTNVRAILKREDEKETDWIDKHSVNCYFCGELVDERDCMPADSYNDNDGGDICPKCQRNKDADRSLSLG